MGQKNIAIFRSDDTVWAFAAWKNAIPELIKKHKVIGIYLFPETLPGLKGAQRILWYLTVFGFKNFFIMGLYALTTMFRVSLSGIPNWRSLAKRYQLQLLRSDDPNSETVIQWTRDNNIDIILIMVTQILKRDIIKVPCIGIINKHASILPSCRGIFPFFWGKLTDQPTGLTLHQVDAGIDTGNILIQIKYPDEETNISMLRFYIDIFSLFPQFLLPAIDNLIGKKYFQPHRKLNASYFGLPTRMDYKAYRKKTFKICELSDIWHKLNIKINEVPNEVRGNKY